MENSRRRGYEMVFLAGVLWGAIGFFVNNLVSLGLSTQVIPFLRITAAGLIIIPFFLVRCGPGVLRIDGKGLLYCLGIGLFCQALFNYSYTKSIALTGVSTAVVLLYTAPVFVTVMSKLLFKERITWNKVAALAINIIGCALTVTGGNPFEMSFSPAGVLYGVVAGFCYALLTIISKSAMEDYRPETVTAYSFIFGAVFLALFAKPWQGIGVEPGSLIILLVLGYGITTAMAYISYMLGLSRKLEASRVPVIASVETIVAAVIGIMLFRESAGAVKILGIALVVISIAVMNMKPMGNKK